jgi:hypothetical protein
VTLFPFGQDVTLITRAKSGTDSLGNDLFTTTQTVIPGCPVWPSATTETLTGEDTVTSDLTALLPIGTVITARDAVIVNGLTYEVDGVPAQFISPFTNMQPGIAVNLKLATG